MWWYEKLVGFFTKKGRGGGGEGKGKGKGYLHREGRSRDDDWKWWLDGMDGEKYVERGNCQDHV